LLFGEGLVAADIVCSGNRIAAVRAAGSAAGPVLDVQGCLILPGIVDIHGDAFERQIMPRPKTTFPLDLALLETDRQLAANGISTAYHGVTVSWEPGLRSLAQALKIIDAVDRLEGQFLVDHRIHIRWETFALGAMSEIQALFTRPKKPLLAFNDHTTPTITGARADNKIQGSADRAMMEVPAYMRLLDEVGERMAEVPGAIASMAAAANAQCVPLLSHDDVTPEMRSFHRGLGAHIAEFPMNHPTLAASVEAGDVIVLGAPNVVRGGSHNGAIGAEDSVRDGKCTVLASDYYYPAPLQAAFLLEERGVLPLEQAWALISAAPAAACGLAGRGHIAEGNMADLVIVSRDRHIPAATIVGGRVVYRTF
jgi:alpha-D-ribose 1-methylphosphonate 5-triphosphate diphosphatase